MNVEDLTPAQLQELEERKQFAVNEGFFNEEGNILPDFGGIEDAYLREVESQKRVDFRILSIIGELP